MILRDFQKKIDSNLDQLEKESIIIMLFNKLTEATFILFPNGMYKQIKWYQFNRWVALGRIMYSLIKLIMKRK